MANELDEMTGPTNPLGNSTQKQQPIFSDKKSAAAKKLNKTVLSRMGIFGSAAEIKVSANDDPQAAQQQLVKAEKESRQISSLLVVMVNVLSSIDGHLKNQLQSSAYIHSQQQRTSREASIETPAAPEQQALHATPVASNDNSQAHEVSKTATIATAIALAGIGAMIASYSGIMGNIKNAFSMLTGAANQTKDLEAGGDEVVAPPPAKAPKANASKRGPADVKSKPAAQQDPTFRIAQATPSLLNPDPGTTPPPPPPPKVDPKLAPYVTPKKPNFVEPIKPAAKPVTIPYPVGVDPRFLTPHAFPLGKKAEAAPPLGQINPKDVLNFTANTGSFNNFTRLKPDMQTAVLNAAKEYMDATGKKLTVNSAYRDTAEQKRLYDISVQNGTPGRLNGRPVAQPSGNHPHGRGYSIDIEESKPAYAEAELVRRTMGKYNLEWMGLSDDVHFTLRGYGGRAETGGVEGGTTMINRMKLAGEDIKKILTEAKSKYGSHLRVYNKDAEFIKSMPKNEKQITQEALERERDIISKNKAPDKPLQTPDLTNVIRSANPQQNSTMLASNDVIKRYMFMMLGQRIDLSSDPLMKLAVTA